jgi:hypothetical protein
MGMSENLISALTTYFHSKRESNLRIADYLEEIAKEATDIALIWQQAVEKLDSSHSVDVSKLQGGEGFFEAVELVSRRNAVAYSRLRSFYKNVSSVVNGRNKSNAEPIVFHIACILLNRDLAKDMVEEQLRGIKSVQSFDGSTSMDSTKSLSKSVQAMHEEAASLHVFAKSFRANIR